MKSDLVDQVFGSLLMRLTATVPCCRPTIVALTVQFFNTKEGQFQGRIRVGGGGVQPLQLPPLQSDTSPFMLYSYINSKFRVLPRLPRSLQQQERLLPGFQPAGCLREMKREGATGYGS